MSGPGLYNLDLPHTLDLNPEQMGRIFESIKLTLKDGQKIPGVGLTHEVKEFVALENLDIFLNFAWTHRPTEAWIAFADPGVAMRFKLKFL